jgi:hypothetical protein
MPNDTRELPATNDGLTRFLGGSPLAVAFRLVLLSILVGVVLAAIGFDPWNIIQSILLGAVIVLPIWFVTRLITPGRR